MRLVDNSNEAGLSPWIIRRLVSDRKDLIR